VLVFFAISKSSSGAAHNQSAVKTTIILAGHRAELSLRAADGINVLPGSSALIDTKSATNTSLLSSEFTNELKTGKSRALATEAEKTLEHASEQDKFNTSILTRKIVLEHELNENTDKDMAKLGIACDESQGSDLAAVQALMPIFRLIYSRTDNVKEPTEEKSFLTAAAVLSQDKILGTGWFKERAMLRLKQLNRQSADYQKLLQDIKNKSWTFMFRLMAIAAGTVVLALIGLVIVVWQLFYLGKSERSKQNRFKEANAGAKYGWSAVLLVFYAWFCTQLFFGLSLGWLKKHNFIHMYGGSNPLAVATTIALIYLLSNGPVLAYIYFFALKPENRSFLQGINLQAKNGVNDVFKLVGMGFLAWLAAIPLVIFAYLLSIKLFNAAGSSNPIIAIIMESAGTDNIAAILLFYTTLGIMAPFIEESLFRGFFYSFLRSRYGPLLSNIVSASLFAAAHLDPGAALPLFCLGSIFAYLFEITGSIVPGIVAHGLWNSGTFTLVLLLFGT
jgi:membrane protease YdiL (CAAX protease family)